MFPLFGMAFVQVLRSRAFWRWSIRQSCPLCFMPWNKCPGQKFIPQTNKSLGYSCDLQIANRKTLVHRRDREGS